MSIVDVEITGAANVAIDLSDGRAPDVARPATFTTTRVRRWPSAAGASPRINHNVFARNGLSERVSGGADRRTGTRPAFFGNVFQGIAAEAFRALGEAAGGACRSRQLVLGRFRLAESLVDRPARATRVADGHCLPRVGPYEIRAARSAAAGWRPSSSPPTPEPDRRVALKLVPTGTDREAREILDAERWGAKLQEQFCTKQPVTCRRSTSTAPVADTSTSRWSTSRGRTCPRSSRAGPLAPERAVGDRDPVVPLSRSGAQLRDVRSTAARCDRCCTAISKPRNIRVLDGDQIKVLDFGIAKALSLSRKVTRNDFGSIAYLSPEWLESGGTSTRTSDFWAVGVLLYEMVAGVQPFVAADTRRLEQRIQSRQPSAALRPSALSAPDCAAIVVKLLAGRLRTATATRDAIRAGSRIASKPDGRLRPSMKAGRRAADRRAADAAHPSSATAAEEAEEATRRTRARTPHSRSRRRQQRRIAPWNAAAGESRQEAATVGSDCSRAALLLMALRDRLQRMLRGPGRRASRGGRADAGSSTSSPTPGSVRQAPRGAAASSIGVIGLERALAQQTVDAGRPRHRKLPDALPSVRETQWKMARDALAHAAERHAGRHRLEARRSATATATCTGSTARRARRAVRHAEAQQEFTDAVTAFREAAELRPNWPDPFLGLDADVHLRAGGRRPRRRRAAAGAAPRLHRRAIGRRCSSPTAIVARGDTLARTARTLAGLAQEQEYLTRAAEPTARRSSFYAKVARLRRRGPKSRQAQRGLRQVEQRIANLSKPTAGPTPESPNRGDVNLHARGCRDVTHRRQTRRVHARVSVHGDLGLSDRARPASSRWRLVWLTRAASRRSSAPTVRQPARRSNLNAVARRGPIERGDWRRVSPTPTTGDSPPASCSAF